MSAPARKPLTRLHKTALILMTVMVVAIGTAGIWGTLTNMSDVFGAGTAVGIVAAAEGAVLLASMTTVGLTVLERPTPAVLRFALAGIPVTAAVVGFTVAPSVHEAVAFAFTQLAMVAAAEGGALVARNAVAYVTGIDPNALKRNADIAQRLNYHAAAAQNHPSRLRRRLSEREAWRLLKYAGIGDNTLAQDLAVRQRARIAEGADAALVRMLALPAAVPALPVTEAAPAIEATPGPETDHGVPEEPGDASSPRSAEETPAQVIAEAGSADGPEATPAGAPPSAGNRFEAVLTDEELYEQGRKVWLALDKPRSQARFLDALKTAGIKASTDRKRALHKRLVTETVSDAVDVIGLDVTDDELTD